MKKLLLIIIAIITLGTAWWLGSPLLFDKTINEDFPVVESNKDKQEMTLEEFDRALNDFTMETVNREGIEALDNMDKRMMEKAAEMPDITVKEKMKTENPVLVAEGNFFDGDDFHKGSGKVKLFKNPDGSHLVRLENFEVTNGPDLYVYLTNTAGAKNSEEVKAGFYSAGRLKGNKGNQNYMIPAEVDISQYKGISIYCRAFSVLFSSANLTTANNR